jgi:glycerol-3-phosphate dehydrogenase (NAD(P)+)
MTPIGILGAGSWGTALAVSQALAGRAVVLWARRRELAEELAATRRSPYLPGVELPAAVEITADLATLAAAPLVLLVAPSHGLRVALRALLAAVTDRQPRVLISAAKGIEGDTLARMSQVCFEESHAADRDTAFAALSGPTFAAEVAAGMPAAAVVAAEDGNLAARVQAALATPALRLYSSTDVVGVELGGAAKNVIAIAAGVVAGLGIGTNALAALITRGLHELTRLGVACGGRPRTFSGLAGLGDLVLTCTGHLSRNRRAGLLLAAGKTPEEIAAETSMVAEGMRNSRAIARLAERKGVEMPITRQMVAMLYEGKPPRQAVAELMSRGLKAEDEL